MDAAELQKKLANMVKKRKLNKPNGKRKDQVPNRHLLPFFLGRNGFEGNQDEGRG